MLLLVYLAVQRKAKTLLPVATPTVVQLVAVDAFSEGGLLGSCHREVEVLRGQLRRRADKPFRHEFQFPLHDLLMSLQHIAFYPQSMGAIKLKDNPGGSNASGKSRRIES
jgi:hypothetical protein